MTRVFLFLILSLLSVISIYSQAEEIFVIVDPDGYVNVREIPSINAPILGQAISNDLLSLPGCDLDVIDTIRADNWLPIGIVLQHEFRLGYVYKDRLRALDDCPILVGKRKGNVRIFEDGVFSLSITAQDSIENISMKFNGVALSFPKEYYTADYLTYNDNPFHVYKHPNRDTYYLFYSLGDDGEYYRKLFTIDSTGIINDEWFHCERPILVLKKTFTQTRTKIRNKKSKK